MPTTEPKSTTSAVARTATTPSELSPHVHAAVARLPATNIRMIAAPQASDDRRCAGRKANQGSGHGRGGPLLIQAGGIGQ
jgi:hypothetical protein